MENYIGNRQYGKVKPSQLATENQALRDQVAALTAAGQAAVEKLEKLLATEQQYQESQVRFQTLFEQSRLGNKIIAPDLRILKVNQALVAMLGYTKSEMEGTRIMEYARADYVKHWEELQDSLWTRHIPSFHVDTLLVKKDGSTIWCSVNSILFKDGRETLGYTTLEDISERKELEAKHQALFDAQQTVMYTVAHDLKNPILHVKTLSGFIRDAIEGGQTLPPDPEQGLALAYLTMIENACGKAYAIIDDLLLVGELAPGQPLAKETVDLKRFITDRLPPFAVTAGKKGVGLRTEFPDGPADAPIHPEKFTRVLENLLSNAVKFTPSGGQITVSVQPEGKRVLLKVQDDGVGIPKPLQALVFNKFTKANRPGTGGEASTGLGLFIVRQIVTLHGGTIWLESAENQGTAFYVALPAG
jgi:two-component system sensor histidine kinase VicK